MLKKYLVEIDYEESEKNENENSAVLSEVSLEICCEKMMKGYEELESIKSFGSVKVSEIS